MSVAVKWIFGGTRSAPTPVPVVAQQPPIVSTADAKLFGLENFGNTCYANSVLQALYFCGPFRELLLQYPDPSAPEPPSLPPNPPPPVQQPSQPAASTRKRPPRHNSISEPPPLHPNAPPAIPIPPSPPTLMSALRSLFLHISKNPADKGTVAPKAFIDKLKEVNELFRGSMHQDAHEFLNYLLNRIMEDMEEDGRRIGAATNGGNKSGEDLSTSIATLSTQPAASTSTAQAMAYHSTIVHRLFEGVLTSETRCLTCETVSSRDESFIDLSIDIEQNSSVTACLRQFSASEMLCQKNKFFCDSCCDLQEAEKRMKIKKLPNVLALHLKRFKYQEDLGKYIKLAYRVAFPLELRLFNTVDDAEDPDRLYELFAIVVHIGTGPHHGHYVTIIKARGAWMLFDDDTVTTIKESDIPKYFGDSNSGSAYVLYYQAVDLDLAALGLKTPAPPPSSTAATDIGSAPGKPVSLATAELSEEAPGSPAYPLPPGLPREEADYSDKSDSPIPSTRFTHPPSMSPNHTPKPPPINVSIPSSQSMPMPTSPSQPHYSSSLRKILTPPSLRSRNGSGHVDKDKRSGDSSGSLQPSQPLSPSKRRPPTATSTTSTAETSHTHETTTTTPSPSVPSSPIPPSSLPLPNGTPSKDEKKPWYKRKPSRQDIAPLSPIKPRLGRRGSEAAISDTSSPVSSPRVSSVPMPPLPSGSITTADGTPLPSLHKKSSPELSRTAKHEKRGSAQSRRPWTAEAAVGGGSSSSSSPATSMASRSRPSSGVAMPPPMPPMPGSPMSLAPSTVINGKEPHAHGRSRERQSLSRSASTSVTATATQAQASGSESERRRRSQAQSETLEDYALRKSESRQSQNQPRPLPPMPPVPSRPSSSPQPISRPSSTAPSSSAHAPHPLSSSNSHSTSNTHSGSTAHVDSHSYPFGLSYGGTGGGGIGDTPVVPTSHGHSSGGGSASSAANNWKRATRKLSFGAPMLGFGRKEKERERERERERHREGPPSAFAR